MPVDQCQILKHYMGTKKTEKLLRVATYALKVSRRELRKNAAVENIATKPVLVNVLMFKVLTYQSLS